MKPPAAAIFRRGQKEELFDALSSGTTDDATVLDAQLNELCAVWAVPRAGKDLAAGIWRPHMGAVEVLVKGKQPFSQAGFMMAKKLYLHIEEAVFFMDRSNLLLFVEEAGSAKRLLALQEAYALMEALGVSIERYVLYSHLSKAGYVVKRHPSRFLLQGSEQPHDIWGSTPAWCCCDGRAAETAGTTATAQAANAAGTAGAPGAAGGRGGSNGNRMASTSAGVSAPEQACKRQKRDGKVPSVAQQGWWPDTSSTHPWLAGALPEAIEAPSIPVNPSVSAQLRQHHPRLKPLPSIPRSTDGAMTALAALSPCVQLVYDVYPSNVSAKRASPDPVAFRLCLVTSNYFPGLSDLQAAAQASPDAPARLVSVEDGDCMFFDVQLVNLLDSIQQPRV